MLRGRSRSLSLVFLVLAACGGAPAVSKTAADGTPEANVSIGDSAAAQGGLSALGGGSNRGSDAPLASALHLDLVDPSSPVKVDGVLREWPARVGAGTRVAGNGKAQLAVAVQYDDARIYVGGDVSDATFVRTPRFGEGEDHASLVLAFPVGNGSAIAGYEVAFYAGKPGESEGAVRFASGARKGQAVPGARIVEAENGAGYTFEASLPWSVFPEARTTRVGLRGVARYYDVDAVNGAKSIVATGSGEVTAPSSLPPLLTESEQAVAEGLLAPKGLSGAVPKFDLVADVAGDGQKERITVYDRLLAICGPGYRGGKEYFFRDLGADVVRLEARAVTGHAKDDLLVRRRFDANDGTREWFEVWTVLPGSDEPQATFAHEIAVAQGGKHVENAVHVGAKEIEVSVEPAVGWDASSYREPIASDVQPILFPWGGVKSRVFRFEGKGFVKVKEVTQTPAPGAAAVASTTPGETMPAREKEPPTPSVHKGGDLSAQLLDQYRHDRGIDPSIAPKVDLQVQVSGDPRPERVLLVNKDLVVFGPGFKGGTGYATLTLQQFESPADVKDVTARDLNGDGNADLVVRGVRRVNAQGGGSHAPVESETMFVYEVREQGLSRIFAIETAREQAGRRVQGLVQFVPAAGGKAFEIDVRPGAARGWTEKTYPWAQDPPGSGNLEPLLLPWGGIGSLRYAWNGSAFAARTP